MSGTMDNLFIEKTKSTPTVDFNAETGKLKIEGKSYPENAPSFYKPVIDWLENYIKENDGKIEIDFDIIYLNTSTTKIIMSIFNNLNEHFNNGKNIIINWLYDSENEMAQESGEEFAEDLTVPFNLIEKD